MPTQEFATSEPVSFAGSQRMRDPLLLWLLCLLVYNANLRVISSGDAYPARYLPFGIWRYHTLALDPIETITAQGHSTSAYWIVRIPRGHHVSLYPVVAPVLASPLYLPAVVYLNATGWEQSRLDRLARIMEKLSASLVAATSVALFYLLARRRARRASALLLTLALAFGTDTWVISSQALWQHGVAELLIVATLLLVTGPLTNRGVFAAGLLCGLIACNRPPDAVLAAALGIYALSRTRRLAPLLLAGAALPLGLVLAYNLWSTGFAAGAYWFVVNAWFFRYGLFSGFAGMLVSPARGLLVFSPFLLFLPFCAPRALRDPGMRWLTMAIGIAVVALLLIYAKADWRQGYTWGPRYLTDTLPLLLWIMTPGVDHLAGARRLLFVSACVVSMAIQAVGAFWYYGTSDDAIYAASGPYDMRQAWDIRNTPFIAELRHSRAPAELLTEVRGSIDAMTATSGGIELAGWALAGTRTPAEAIALVDGQRVTSTENFLPRPDVIRTLGPSNPAGWLLTVPIPGLAAGEHDLAVVVRANSGGDLFFLTERRFTVPGR